MKYLPKLLSQQRCADTGFAAGIQGIFYSGGDPVGDVASLGKQVQWPYD